MESRNNKPITFDFRLIFERANVTGERVPKIPKALRPVTAFQKSLTHDNSYAGS